VKFLYICGLNHNILFHNYAVYSLTDDMANTLNSLVWNE